VRIDDVRSALSSVGGKALGQVFGAAAALRRKKPLHPRGSVVPIRLVRGGLYPGLGVPWLDEPGIDTGIARFSRSVGLPSALPDILGLAIRLEAPGQQHDLLLATTGRRPVARSVLVPRSTPLTATYGSLFPYETPQGNVVFAAWPVSLASHAPAAFTLAVATPVGAWHEFAVLELQEEPQQASDETLDFDPVLHPLPGLALSRRFAALREPAYASARAHRPGSHSGPPTD
jgi:hypothetical protein